MGASVAWHLRRLGVEDVVLVERDVLASGSTSKSAGGFRMQKAVIRASVPAPLLAADRAKIEKTLSLAEKYCIISKVARAAMPLSVEIVES